MFVKQQWLSGHSIFAKKEGREKTRKAWTCFHYLVVHTSTTFLVVKQPDQVWGPPVTTV